MSAAPAPPRLPAVSALLLAALSVAAEEPNPVRPGAVELLREQRTCVAFAEEAGRALVGRECKDPSVYSGDAGVAILFVGLYRATRKKEWLDAARARLDAAVARMGDDPGLYSGRAGIGQVCLDAYRASGEEAFLAKARECAKGLGEGPPGTDIISGAAGIGIFQLNLHAQTGAKEDLDAARRTGDWLARRAIGVEGLACWRVGADETSRIYTGFSNGAAGIGYFLLGLARATGEQYYLDLAQEAARFVARNAMPDGEDGWLWYRTVPPIKDEEILIQWCHGAPGNGLLFAALVRAGKGSFRPALDRCLATTRRSGRTARAGGCQCHGAAGNAELLLEAYVLTGDKTLLDEARRSGSALLVPSGDGFAVDTDYDPSYMLGLAGIGHFFLRLADPAGTPLPLMVADGPREGGK